MPLGEVEERFPVGGNRHVALAVIMEGQVAADERRVERWQVGDSQIALAEQAIDRILALVSEAQED